MILKNTFGDTVTATFYQVDRVTPIDFTKFSTPTSKTFVFVAPDGTRITKNASWNNPPGDGSDGTLAWTTQNIFNQDGVWAWYAQITDGTTYCFQVPAQEFPVNSNP